MSLTNPYSAGSMTTNPNMFFGREEELKRICNRLSKGDSTAVVGLRRIGKSSLLYQLAHQTKTLPDYVVPVYLDLQDATYHKPLDLLTATLRALDERLGYRYRFTRVESLAAFSAGVKRIADDGLRPVLCLDEIEELTDHPDFDDNFFESLRSLGSQRKLVFVVASGESLDLLLKQKSRTSPFYNIFINLYLAGLSDEAARDLLVKPFRRENLAPPSSDYIDYALRLAGHHPFYLQILGAHMFWIRAKYQRMDRDDLYQVFISEAQPHFRGLWRHLSPIEQAGLRKVIDDSIVVQNWQQIHQDLIHRGLVEKYNSKSRVFSDVLATLIQNREIEREQSTYPARSEVDQLRSAYEHTGTKSQAKLAPNGLSVITRLFAYTWVALVSAVMAFLIALLLPRDSFWIFFSILTIFLTFTLVGIDKLTGSQFLEWLSKLLGKWK